MPLRKTKVGERLWGAGPESLRKHLAGNFCTIAQILSCVPRNLKYKRLQKDQLRQVSSQEKTYFSALKLRILESIYGKFILAYSAVSLQNKRQWDFKKNHPVTPDNISFGSGREFWWLCPLGHSYKRSANRRSTGLGCYYCSGRKTLNLDLFDN